MRKRGRMVSIDCITDEGGFKCGGGKSEQLGSSSGAGPSGLLAAEMIVATKKAIGRRW